jgi:hypothetical protein
MISMPKIGQFRDAIREVKNKATFVEIDETTGKPIYNSNIKLPVLTYHGSVKIHGTNAAIVYTWNAAESKHTFHTQSRNCIITPDNDNFGFASFIYNKVDTNDLYGLLLKAIIGDKLGDVGYLPQSISVFGEYCGGTIQKNVAVSKLEKMFVIFAIKIDDIWTQPEILKQIKLPESKIYNILDYPCYEIEIDFNDPKAIQNKLVELTLQVERQCPVGKAFNVSGVGEGLVFKCYQKEYNSYKFAFKVKGDEHSKNAGRVKTLAPVDTERFDNIKAIVESVVTNRRLEQGIEYLNEKKLAIDKKNIGVYLKWILDDINSEEHTTIAENGFTMKNISAEISKKAKDYFLSQIIN